MVSFLRSVVTQTGGEATQRTAVKETKLWWMKSSSVVVLPQEFIFYFILFYFFVVIYRQKHLTQSLISMIVIKVRLIRLLFSFSFFLCRSGFGA